MSIDQRRGEFIAEIFRERNQWTWCMIPQIVILMLTSAFLALGGIWGIYFSLATFRENPDAELARKMIGVFAGGSSAILSFFATRLLLRLNAIIESYFKKRQRFTSFATRAGLVVSRGELDELANEYARQE